jgi:hypothetical protein
MKTFPSKKAKRCAEYLIRKQKRNGFDRKMKELNDLLEEAWAKNDFGKINRYEGLKLRLINNANNAG